MIDGIPDHLIAQILLTLSSFGYSVAAARADLNQTHATNPLWTPHARLHVVWQISSYVGLGLLVLWLIWAPTSHVAEHLYLAAAIGLVVYASFFVSVFTRGLYGGKTFDENGYLPFAPPIRLFAAKWDINISGFTVFTLMLLASILII